MIDAAIERGRPLPQFALDEPLLAGMDGFYMEAFSELSTCRPLGFGCVGPIPWSDIAAYATLQGLDSDVRRAFGRIIRQMDSLGYLPWQAAEAEKNRPKAGKK